MTDDTAKQMNWLIRRAAGRDEPDDQAAEGDGSGDDHTPSRPTMNERIRNERDRRSVTAAGFRHG